MSAGCCHERGNLIDEGYDRDSARFFVAEEIGRVLEEQASSRRAAEEA